MDADVYQRRSMRGNPDEWPAHIVIPDEPAVVGTGDWHHELTLTRLAAGGLGIAGEAGEIADEIKKIIFHAHGRDATFVMQAQQREHISQELGDALWYIALIADALGLRLSTIMRDNIAKLEARYPNGFNAQDSAKPRS